MKTILQSLPCIQRELDVTLTDTKQLFDSLINLVGKSQFETKDEYQARLKKAIQSTVKGRVYFEIKQPSGAHGSRGDFLTYSYDAEQGLMFITVREASWGSPSRPERIIRIEMIEEPGTKLSSFPFSKTQGTADTYGIIPSNIYHIRKTSAKHENKTLEHIIASSDSNILVSFKVSADVAKGYIDNHEVTLIIGGLINDMSTAFKDNYPTTTKLEFSYSLVAVPVEISEILVYHKPTQNILAEYKVPKD